MAGFSVQLGHFIVHGLGILAIVLAIGSLVGTLYVLLFAFIGIFTARPREESAEVSSVCSNSSATTDFLAVIPAHNESSGLTAAVESVMRQDYPRFICVVVADNCTDDTAEMAAAAGAHHVLIRNNPELRGKGHALTWAFDVTKNLVWDAACVIDADGVLAPGFFGALDTSFRRGNLAVQARSEFLPPTDDKNWLEQFSAISKAGENSFIYRSRERMGLAQLIMGNGFCLSRAALERVPWQAHSIAEDAEYAISLEQQGIRVHYQENARLWSRQASTVRDVQPQRIRWASGIWQLFRQAIPALLAKAWRERDWRALEEILMLLVTSRLVLIYLVVFSFLLSLASPSFFIPTVSILLVVAVLQLLYLVLMFRFAGDRPMPLKGLLLLPYYVWTIAFSQILALTGFNRSVWWRTTR